MSTETRRGLFGLTAKAVTAMTGAALCKKAVYLLKDHQVAHAEAAGLSEKQEDEEQIIVDPIEAEAIERFFGSRPAARYAEYIVRKSIEHGISVDLIPIIGMSESGGGSAKQALSWFATGIKDPQREIDYLARLLAGQINGFSVYGTVDDEIRKLQIFNGGRVGRWNDPNYPNKYKLFKSQLTQLRQEITASKTKTVEASEELSPE